MRYIVCRDTREHEGQGWYFTASRNCEAMIVVTLRTGDYTIQGYEKLVIIERKADTGEFVKNIVQDRFDRELKRLEEFPHPFIILEFTLEDVINFPVGSGIPEEKWPYLKVSNWYFLKRIMELEMKYKTKIIFAGKHGKEVAASIFKRVVEQYGTKEKAD